MMGSVKDTNKTMYGGGATKPANRVFVEFHNDLKDVDPSFSSSCVDQSPHDSNDVLPAPTKDDLFIQFNSGGRTRRRASLESADRPRSLSDFAVRQLRSTMPDQTRRVLNAVSEDASSSSSQTSSSINSSDILFASINSSSQNITPDSNSTKFSRSYSKPQGDLDNQLFVSSQDNDTFQKFQHSFEGLKSVFSRGATGGGGGLRRISTSPDFLTLSADSQSQQQQASSERKSVLAEGSILAKMVGARNKQLASSSSLQQQQQSIAVSDSSSASSSSLPSSSQVAELRGQVAASASKSTPSIICPPATNCPKSDCERKAPSSSDSSSSSGSSSSGFGILSKTRHFGAWLSTAVDRGEKVQISKKDLNVFAPTTF